MTSGYDWQGRVGDTWAEEWRLTDMSFAGLAVALDGAIAAAAPERGRALDIGCGAGATSLALAAARPEVEVTGIDLSERLVDVARERGKTVPNASFQRAEAVGFLKGREFDLAFSRHGVMFFPDPQVAFRAIRQALRPGAALVFSCFASLARNPWATEIAAAAGASGGAAANGYSPGPFAFAEPEFVRGLLESNGFSAGAPQLIDYAYRAGKEPDALAQALHFFRRIGPAAPLFAAAEPAERAAMRERLAAFLADRLRNGVIEFPATAWIWSARAVEK